MHVPVHVHVHLGTLCIKLLNPIVKASCKFTVNFLNYLIQIHVHVTHQIQVSQTVVDVYTRMYIVY